MFGRCPLAAGSRSLIAHGRRRPGWNSHRWNIVRIGMLKSWKNYCWKVGYIRKCNLYVRDPVGPVHAKLPMFSINPSLINYTFTNEHGPREHVHARKRFNLNQSSLLLVISHFLDCGQHPLVFCLFYPNIIPYRSAIYTEVSKFPIICPLSYVVFPSSYIYLSINYKSQYGSRSNGPV